MKKLSEKFFLYADRHISPFEGGGGMLIINELSKSLLIPISSLIDKIKLFRQPLIF